MQTGAMVEASIAIKENEVCHSIHALCGVGMGTAGQILSLDECYKATSGILSNARLRADVCELAKCTGIVLGHHVLQLTAADLEQYGTLKTPNVNEPFLLFKLHQLGVPASKLIGPGLVYLIGEACRGDEQIDFDMRPLLVLLRMGLDPADVPRNNHYRFPASAINITRHTVGHRIEEARATQVEASLMELMSRIPFSIVARACEPQLDLFADVELSLESMTLNSSCISSRGKTRLAASFQPQSNPLKERCAYHQLRFCMQLLHEWRKISRSVREELVKVLSRSPSSNAGAADTAVAVSKVVQLIGDYLDLQDPSVQEEEEKARQAAAAAPAAAAHSSSNENAASSLSVLAAAAAASDVSGMDFC